MQQLNTDTYEAFFNSAREGMIILDAAGSIKGINSAARELIGFIDKEVRHIKIDDLFDEKYRQELLDIRNALLAKRTRHKNKILIPDLVKNGQQRVVALYFNNHIRSENGPLIAAVVMDETQQWQDKQELKQSQERFRKTFYSSPVAQLITDAEYKNITHVNKKFLALTGYERDEVIGENISSIGLNPCEAKIETGSSGQVECEAIAHSKEGTVINVLQSSVLVNINSLSHELWTLIDITERKQAELDLKKINNDLDKKVKERTKELSEMLEKEKNTSDQKSRFISTASHEFRTPLTTILMSAGLLENYAKTSEIDKCEKHIRRIRSSVKLLVEILDYFLSLDKLEQGKIDINISSFDFKAFADDVINYAGEWLKEGQTIVLSMVGDNMINQDKALLRGIMFHLLSNASKYSAEGAKISVSVTVKRNTLFMNVSDKGIGIPANDQPYIFSRFFRAKNAELIQGTGLGLSIVNNYVKLLHGSIYFKSVENEGTAFAIELPIGKK